MSDKQYIKITFKTNGSELSNYMDQIKKKGEELGNSAIADAMKQTKASKEQLKIINEQIAALEKKNRLEAQAKRSIALEQRDSALQQNKDYYEGKRNEVFADTKLSEKDKKERITTLSGVEAAIDQKIKNDYRENLTVLKEQERQNKLQTALSREQIQTAKEAAREQVATIRSGDKSLADVYKEVGSQPSEEEKLTIKMIEEQLAEQKRKDKQDGKKNDIIGSILAVDNLNKVISTAGQFSQTQNGFDLIQPASNTAGRIIGGILGGVIGSLAGGIGAVAGAGVGAEIGGGLGDTIGALEQRQAMSKEAFRKAAMRYNAITGSDVDSSSIPDMSDAGVNYTQYMQMRSEYARRRGYSAGSDKTTRDAAYLEKGLGVDQGISAAIVELQRSAKEGNRDLAKLVGGILEKGQGSIFKNGDTTFLNEFLGKFTTLQKELLKTQTTVSSGLTMDILKQFNSLGGMFDSRDPRSQGIISSINGSLSNPSSDNTRAIAYRILSKQYPNKGIFDLNEEIQKGLGSPQYLKGILEQVDRVGGDDQLRMINLSGFLKGVPLAAIRTLFKHRGELRNFSTSELKSFGLTDEVLRGRAERNTTDLEKNTAKIENGILSGQAISSMSDAFVKAIESAMSGAVIELKNGQGTIRMKGAAAIPQNTTKNPVQEQVSNRFSYNNLYGGGY